MAILGMSAFGQNAPDLPSREVVLYPVVSLSFGNFTVPSGSTGGHITVDCGGSCTSYSNVIMLNMGSIPPVREAIFEFKLCPGRKITITYPTQKTISGYGVKGGEMTINDLTFLVEGGTIDNSGTGFIEFTSNKGCDEYHRIHMGGTLVVGSLSENPPGPYNTDIPLTITPR